MKNKNFGINLIITIIVSIVFGCIFFFEPFINLDHKLYDALIKIKSGTTKNEKIVVVQIDDSSIESLGEWPWSRDVMGDTLLRLKELQAATVSFDIEYVSPSKQGIASSASQIISDEIGQTKNLVSDTLNQLSSAVSKGYYSAKEIPELTNQMLSEYLNPAFTSLHETIQQNVYRDNDDYFGRCLEFFENSFVTINTQYIGVSSTEDEINYTKTRHFLTSVEDKNNLIHRGNLISEKESEYIPYDSFSPTLHKIGKHAYGVGFTNSLVDKDGTRRRMELLHDYDGTFAPSLVLAPLLKIVDSKDITVKKNKLIIHNAKLPEEKSRKDIKIPLDDANRILVNWRQGTLDESFNTVKIINILNLDYLEQNLKNCLTNIYADQLSDADGYEMQFSISAKNLLDNFYELSVIKSLLLGKCEGFDINGIPVAGITPDEYKEYFAAIEEVYTKVKTYIDSDFYSTVLNRLEEIKNYIDEDTFQIISANLEEDFTLLPLIYNEYVNLKNQLAGVLNGAYCIVGNTATGTTDLGSTPLKRKYENVGIHANILNTILNEEFLVPLPWYIGFIATILIALLSLLFVNKSPTYQNVITGVIDIAFIGAALSSFIFFDFYSQFVCIILFIIVHYIANFSYRFYVSSKEKHFITLIASSFANKDTVDQLRKNPESFRTEGEKKNITALFSDIQKFSTFSENITKIYGEEGPNRLIEVLNEYLGNLSNQILLNSGNIDKYEGDAIISMFGAPDSLNEHTKEEWAYACLASAIGMKKQELQFNQEHQELFRDYEITNENGETEIVSLKPFNTRIGINSGEAFVGLMGSKTESFSKLNYTMIGDTVNLASRLEGVNKVYNSWIMCSDATWNLANSGENAGKIIARKLDRVRVVGRNTPVQLYNIIGFRDEMTPQQIEEIDIFHAALDKYFAKDFVTAGKLFMQSESIFKQNGPALVFAERCKNNIEKGVPENWDGVVNMTSK